MKFFVKKATTIRAVNFMFYVEKFLSGTRIRDVDHMEIQIQLVVLKGFKETVLDFEGSFHIVRQPYYIVNKTFKSHRFVKDVRYG